VKDSALPWQRVCRVSRLSYSQPLLPL